MKGAGMFFIYDMLIGTQIVSQVKKKVKNTIG